MPEHEARNLEELIEQIFAAAEVEHNRISVADVLEAVGSRSFAPLLLLTGVLLVSPLSGVPTFATSMGIIVALVSIQMLLGRAHLWLPAWLLRRSLDRATLHRVLHWLRPRAQTVDRFLRPRLTRLVQGPGQYLIAGLCLLIAGALPLMEVIPFSASLAGVALATLGLSLVANDGALALLAYAVAAVVGFLILGS
ncbi:MAG: exopolysaccharide biosynthesis protein [Gammaproteobacteria bacterium]